MITFSTEAWAQLLSLSESAYPYEGCGLLLGPYVADRKKTISEVVTLRNTLRDQGRGRFDFELSTQEFAQAQMAADKRALDVIGIFHTHPDHPPRPSVTDASQPMLSGWVNVIASVHGNGSGGGKFNEAKAWWRDDERRDFEEIDLAHV
jgi:proteasome lid subunit RPN8/RPN11